MNQDVPKPGPHLHLIPTATPAPIFRELAKSHASAASDLAVMADVDYSRTGKLDDNLLDLAQVHAQVSQACSLVAPPARRRYIHQPEGDLS